MAEYSIQTALEMKSAGLISNTDNLNGAPVYIFSGALDPIYGPHHQEAQRQYYDHFGANVEFVQLDVGHAVPATYPSSSHWFYNPTGVAYDLSGNMLRHLITNVEGSGSSGTIREWVAADPDWRSKGVLKKFYQNEFLDTFLWQPDSLADYGYVYYPYSCIDGSRNCKVHMYLHGCHETVDGLFPGIESLSYGGRLAYAASNDIIVLMPQAKFSLFTNIDECFDFNNHLSGQDRETDRTFISKNGRQVKALKAMLDRVIEPRSETYDYTGANILEFNVFQEFFFTMWRYALTFPNWILSSLYIVIIYQIPGMIDIRWS